MGGTLCRQEGTASRQDGLAAVLHKEMLVQRRQLRAPVRRAAQAGVILALVCWCLAILAVLLKGIRFLDVYLAQPSPLFLSLDLDVSVLLTGSLFFLILLTLVITGTAGAVARERERHTLELLLLTRLSSAELLAGKLAAPLLPSVAPVMLAFMLVSGVAGTRRETLYLAQLGAAVLLLALLAGTVSLYWSTVFTAPARAVAASAVTVALLLLPLYQPVLEAPLWIFYGYGLGELPIFVPWYAVVLAALPTLATLELLPPRIGRWQPSRSIRLLLFTLCLGGYAVLCYLGLSHLPAWHDHHPVLMFLFLVVLALAATALLFRLSARRLDRLRRAV